jgi:mRNA-degrading endonuclease RelE of RelBE toxin-antitoxin system
MSWIYRFDQWALKELRKFDKQAQREIVVYLDERWPVMAIPVASAKD